MRFSALGSSSRHVHSFDNNHNISSDRYNVGWLSCDNILVNLLNTIDEWRRSFALKCTPIVKFRALAVFLFIIQNSYFGAWTNASNVRVNRLFASIALYHMVIALTMLWAQCALFTTLVLCCQLSAGHFSIIYWSFRLLPDAYSQECLSICPNQVVILNLKSSPNYTNRLICLKVFSRTI